MTETPYGGMGAPEVVAEAVKDSRETLAELRFSARVSVSASQQTHVYASQPIITLATKTRNVAA